MRRHAGKWPPFKLPQRRLLDTRIFLQRIKSLLKTRIVLYLMEICIDLIFSDSDGFEE